MHDVLFVVVPTRMPRRLGSLLRCRAGLANRCAELIKFALGTVQLATDNLQTHDERVNMDTGCCRNSI